MGWVQGQGRILRKMQLRPASLHSKFHKQLLADSQKKHERDSFFHIYRDQFG